MSATIYRALKWCTLNADEITQVVHNICTGFIYKGEDFYNEVEKLDGWKPATEEDDSVCIWNSDDAGPVVINGEEVGLFIHFDEDNGKFDWACTYELYPNIYEDTEELHDNI